MAGYRPSYTSTEDKVILRYILDGDFGNVVKGDSLWKRMEKEEVCKDRTWHSLKNRWLKTISRDFGRPEYKLTSDEKALLKAQMGSINSATRQVHPKLVGRKRANSTENKVQAQDIKIESDSSDSEADKGKNKKDFYSLDMAWSDGSTE